MEFGVEKVGLMLVQSLLKIFTNFQKFEFKDFWRIVLALRFSSEVVESCWKRVCKVYK